MVSTTTKGRARVRVSFNTSKDELVDDLKSLSASLIDKVEVIKEESENPTRRMSETKDQQEEREEAEKYHASEVRRLKSLAQTKAEEACMWAVKAATYFK